MNEDYFTKMKEDYLVLGIDPGSQSTGYGLIKKKGSQMTALSFGCIRPKDKILHYRYRTIFLELEALLESYAPNAVAVETQFIQKNVSSAIKLGMVRGMVLLAASLREIPIFEYAPSKAKRSITGNGLASKEQVGRMIASLLNLRDVKMSEDASDALAIALCHAYSQSPLNACIHS